jgi:enamine deaminase RidA (YjgF/YER057c/UK114 family)
MPNASSDLSLRIAKTAVLSANGYPGWMEDAQMTIEHINPEGLHKSSVFTQGIIIPAGCRTLLIGGQNGVDATGQVVASDMAGQTRKALENLVAVLTEAGATVEDLVSVSIYAVDGHPLEPAFQEWIAMWGTRDRPPVVKFLKVVGLHRPDVLIEIEATAAFK